MPSVRQSTCLIAACLGLVISAGCATNSQVASVEKPRPVVDHALLESMERQMIVETMEKGIRLGAGDSLGQSLYERHRIVALARYRGNPEMIAGAPATQDE